MPVPEKHQKRLEHSVIHLLLIDRIVQETEGTMENPIPFRQMHHRQVQVVGSQKTGGIIKNLSQDEHGKEKEDEKGKSKAKGETSA